MTGWLETEGQFTEVDMKEVQGRFRFGGEKEGIL